MKRKLVAAIFGVVLAVGPASAAFANTGYEGQPGNQSNGGGNHGNNGPTGYEGQPGSQGGH